VNFSEFLSTSNHVITSLIVDL